MSTKAKLFSQLIADFANDGVISEIEKQIILEKGEELGLSRDAVQTMIELELSSNSTITYREPELEDEVYKFKSAITRLGPVLTPHIIEICGDYLTYKKRNKYLINVDTVTIHISKIASVRLDTSLLGTDITIETIGSGTIQAENFTLSDAKKIKKLIERRIR